MPDLIRLEPVFNPERSPETFASLSLLSYAHVSHPNLGGPLRLAPVGTPLLGRPGRTLDRLHSRIRFPNVAGARSWIVLAAHAYSDLAGLPTLETGKNSKLLFGVTDYSGLAVSG